MWTAPAPMAKRRSKLVSWSEEGRLVAREKPPVPRKTKKGPVADRMPQKAREQYERTMVIARESIAIDNADAEKALFKRCT